MSTSSFDIRHSSLSADARRYIELRDGFLAVAKEVRTGPRLDRAWIANEAVASFIPSMEPDDPAAAGRMRARCEEVKAEIDRLRAKISTQPVGAL
jgi:hypothetical protein